MQFPIDVAVIATVLGLMANFQPVPDHHALMVLILN